MGSQTSLQARLHKYLAKVAEDIRDIVISELDNLYQLHQGILDKDWLSIVECSDDDSLEERLLELVVAKHMSTENGMLTKPNVKRNNKAPDFLLNINDNIYPFEVTSVGLPENDSVVKSNIQNFSANKRLLSGEDYERSALCSEIKSRVTQAFKEKAQKYSPSKDHPKDGHGLIILISTGKIPLHSWFEMYELVSVFFGTGNLTFDVDIKQQRIESKYLTYQDSFNKNNGAPISNEWFLSPDYKHVSGVIISRAPSLEMLKLESTNDFILIHNPFATIPVPRGIMPVSNEISLDIKKGLIECLNDNIYPVNF